MKKVLMTWNTNWADEMDISGFVIVTENEMKEWQKKIKNNDFIEF